MNIHKEAGIGALAIASGMALCPDNDIPADWYARRGIGEIELFAEIYELATISAGMVGEIACCAEFEAAGMPGVYAYEVGSRLGGAILHRLLSEPDLESLKAPCVLADLGKLALAFFCRADSDIPLTRALIEKWTGYRGDAVAPAAA